MTNIKWTGSVATVYRPVRLLLMFTSVIIGITALPK